MLIRDKILGNKEFSDNENNIKQSKNNSELMFVKKVFLKDKIETIISESILKNEKEVLSATADAIEVLRANIRSLGIEESELVKIIEQKNSVFGSYDQGFIQGE